jgi:hypothetical protein
MFLSGNFVALPAFQRRYGVQLGGSGWTIPTRWQSALFQSGQCGAFIGVFLAGPITNRLGYRWTTILALVLMNATIFISFFVSGPRLASVLLLSLSPDYIYLGRLTGRPYCWTSVGRRSLGTLHCKLPRLRQRDCSSRPSRCLHSYSANELVYRFNHCRRRHLWLQSARRSVVLANPSCLAVDLPRESLLSGLVPMRADSSRPPSWSSSSSPPNLLGGLFVTDAKRKPFALSSASVRNLERTLNRHWP